MLTTNASLLDGINRHILAVAKAVNARDGFEVAVCTVMAPGELHQALEQEGVKTFALGCANGHDPHIVARYAKVLREFLPDVVHCHVMAIMERLVSACSHRGIKYVQTIHGISDPVPLSPKVLAERALVALTPLRYARNIYISIGVKEALAPADPKGVVVYNPMNFNITPQKGLLHERLGVSGDTPIIGTSCRIAAVKNPEAFTRVMCWVLKSIPDAHAVVMGDGDKALIARCREIADVAGVADRFHWLGFCADAPALVGDLDCFVLTSHREGMPTSVLECFAVRTPVAMLRGEGGLRDLDILNTAARPIVAIADKEDPDGLAAQVVELLRNADKAKAQAENAYQVELENFDIDAVADQLCGIYRQTTQKRMKTFRLYVAGRIFPLIPETRGFGLKRRLLRWCGADVGDNVRVCSSVRILGGGALTIGDNTWVGHDSMLVCSDAVRIGANVNIAPRVFIGTGTHEITPEAESVAGPGISLPIEIGNGCWLCAGATVIAGARLAPMSILAAGALFRSDRSLPHSLYAGIPARHIKFLHDTASMQNEHLEITPPKIAA